MKVAVVSHSLVADRQRWFFDYFRQYTGWDVRQFAPEAWGDFRVADGYETVNPGNMADYEFQQDMLLALEKFHPEILYMQNEAYCKASGQMLKMAKRMGSKFVLFVWENVHQYDAMEFRVRYLLEECDLVVCGNGDAELLVKPYNKETLRCIQVGVDAERFAVKHDAIREYDVIFVGRKDAPEKGGAVLREAAKGTKWKVRWPPESRSAVPYEGLVSWYNSAAVHAAPSIDTPFWREQHSSFAALEAISCGLYNSTTDSASIVEGLRGCPGVTFSKQNDPMDLRIGIESCLYAYSEHGINISGRDWVAERYGNEAIAKKLMEAFLNV